VELDVLLAPAKLGKASANTLRGASSGFSLAVDGGSGVERLDLAQLLQQRSFERQHRPQASTPAMPRQPSPSGCYAATEGARSACGAA
jgi:hypothetical protein